MSDLIWQRRAKAIFSGNATKNETKNSYHQLNDYIDEFNIVTTNAVEEKRFYEDNIRSLIDLTSIELGNYPGYSGIFDEVLFYLNKLVQEILKDSSFEEQYVTWFYAVMQLNSFDQQIARHVANIEPPDRFFNWDSDYWPDDIDLSKMAKSYYGNPLRSAMKHTLNLSQLLTAYRKVIEAVENAGQGWVTYGSGLLIYGITMRELEALQEEGLVNINGKNFTLTRLGYEKPQWYKY